MGNYGDLALNYAASYQELLRLKNDCAHKKSSTEVELRSQLPVKGIWTQLARCLAHAPYQ